MGDSDQEFASEFEVNEEDMAEDDWDELDPAPAVVSATSSSAGRSSSSTPDLPSAAAAAPAPTGASSSGGAAISAPVASAPGSGAPAPAAVGAARAAAPLQQPRAMPAARPAPPTFQHAPPTARPSVPRPPSAGPAGPAGRPALASAPIPPLRPPAAAPRPAGPGLAPGGVPGPRPAAAGAGGVRPPAAGPVRPPAQLPAAPHAPQPGPASQPRPTVGGGAALQQPAAARAAAQRPRAAAAAGPAAARRPAGPQPRGVQAAAQQPASAAPPSCVQAAQPAPDAPASAARQPALGGEIEPAAGSTSAESAVGGPAAAAGPAAGGSGGWGGWGALGRLGASLQAATTTVIKDVSDLGESFSKVLQEVAEASDEEEAAAAGRPARPAPPLGADSPLPPDQHERRRRVLARLAAEDEGAISPPQPRKPQAGHEAGQGTDPAGGGSPAAATALSGLLGWSRGLASRVEAAAASVGRELAETVHEAQPAVREARSKAAAGGRAAEFRIGSTLGALGRHAQGLLESALEGPRRSGAAGGGEAVEAASFADQLYIQGGRGAQEELEGLSSDSARLANRMRSLLPEEERQALEAALADLAPLFDTKAQLAADPACGAGGESGGAAAAVEAGHKILRELSSAGCQRAEALAREAADAAAQLVAGSGNDGPSPAAAADSGEDAGGQSAGSESSSRAGPTPAALRVLAALHAEGVAALAELCSLCLERLLALARSLASCHRYGRPADDGIAWPASPQEAALLLRRQALRMQEDVAAVAAAFGAALASAASSLDAAAATPAGQPHAGAAAPLAHGLQADAEAAAGRLQDACRSLLQVVWLTSVPRDVLEEVL